MATVSSPEEKIIKTVLKDGSQINLENEWGYLEVRDMRYLFLSKANHSTSFWDEFALDRMSICTKLYGKDAKSGICPEVPYGAHMPQAELSLRRLTLFLWRCSNNPEGIKNESWLNGIIEKTIQDIPFPNIISAERSDKARWPMLEIHQSWYESLSILFKICGFAADPAIPNERDDKVILITNYGPKQGVVGYGKGPLRNFLEGNEAYRTVCSSIAGFTDQLREAIVTSGMPIKYQEFSELCVYLNRIGNILQPDPFRPVALYSSPSELLSVMMGVPKFVPGWGKCLKKLGTIETSKAFLSANLSNTKLIVGSNVNEINYASVCPLFTENVKVFLDYTKKLVPPPPCPVEFEEEEEEEDKSGWPVFEGSSVRIEGDIPKETKLRIKCEYIEPTLKLNKLKLKF